MSEVERLYLSLLARCLVFEGRVLLTNDTVLLFGALVVCVLPVCLSGVYIGNVRTLSILRVKWFHIDVGTELLRDPNLARFIVLGFQLLDSLRYSSDAFLLSMSQVHVRFFGLEWQWDLLETASHLLRAQVGMVLLEALVHCYFHGLGGAQMFDRCWSNRLRLFRVPRQLLAV